MKFAIVKQQNCNIISASALMKTRHKIHSANKGITLLKFQRSYKKSSHAENQAASITDKKN